MMDNLIERLEAATEGSRELDRTIYWGLGFPRTGDMEKIIPHYTTSLDSALTLVPEGWDWLVRNEGNNGFANVTRGGVPVEMEGQQINPDWQGNPVYASTPFLALCIAALKARQTMEEER